MGAELLILVRVRADQAMATIERLQKQIVRYQDKIASLKKDNAALQKSLDDVGNSATKARTESNREWFTNLTKSGSQMQWIGRQITANLSGPILFAGGMAIKSALEQDEAMTKMAKVYEAPAGGAKALSNELQALDRNFTALSNRYGVDKKNIEEVAAQWAAAGVAGESLAKVVDLTTRTMVLGELSATDATKALIAIQAQYSLDTQGLTDVIFQLNAAENTAAANMGDLVEGFARAAGVARSAGVDTQHLAAMIASMTPAAGTAAEAGNGLRTMISRILSPTGDAADILGELGVNIQDSSWQALNATDRFELLAKKFQELNGQQQAVVSASLASRYQINKMEILFQDVASGTGYYAKVLDDLSDKTKVYKIAQDELNTVLQSDSSQMKQAGQVIKNEMITAVKPLIPMFVNLAQAVGKIMIWFGKLDPNVQKFIGLFIMAVAVLGPAIVAFAVLKLSIGQLAPIFIWFGKALLSPITGLLRINGAAINAATGLFRLLNVQKLFSIAATVHEKFWAGVRLAITKTFYLSKLAIVKAGELAHLAVIRAGLELRYIATKVGEAAKLAMHGFFISAQIAAVRGSEAIQTALIVWGERSRLFVKRTYGALVLAFHGALITAQKAVLKAGEIAMTALTAGGEGARLTVKRVYGALVLAFHGALITAQKTVLWAGEVAMIALTKAGEITRFAVKRAYGVAVLAFHGALITAQKTLVRAGEIAETALVAAGSRIRLAIHATYGAIVAGIHKVTWANILSLTSRGWKGLITLGSGGIKGFLGILMRFIKFIPRLLLGPVGLVITGVALLFTIFQDQIKGAVRNVIAYFQELPPGVARALSPITGVFGKIRDMIGRAFNALPDSVQNAMLRVWAIVKAVAMKVYDLFSFINPFAQHSPSLVDQVSAGMAAIGNSFGLAERNITGHVQGMHSAIKGLKDASGELAAANAAAERADAIDKISQTAPGAVAAYDQLDASLTDLRADLEAVNTAVEEQQKLVDGLQTKMDEADKAIDKMNVTLESMEKTVEILSKYLDEAQERLDRFSNAQIQGMGAAEEATFQNEMAQKRLQLQIMKLEKASGSVDSMTDAYARLQGQIETLSGQKLELQLGGAGSDITGPYDEMIKSLQAQQAEVASGTAAPIAEIEKLNAALDSLKSEADQMDLENSLRFDPLNRQLELMKSNVEEMPFDQIVMGMNQSQAAVTNYGTALNAANAAVDGQKAAIDSAQSARDALQAQYDLENEKLTHLNDTYQAIEGSIREGEQALQDMTSAADTAIQRAEAAAQKAEEAAGKGPKGKNGKGPGEDGEESLSASVEAFRAAEGAPEFPEVAGEGVLGREGLGDQSLDIDKLTQDLTTEMGDLWGGLNPFQPLIDKWNQAWQWMKDNFSGVSAPLKTAASDVWGLVTDPFLGRGGDGKFEALSGWIDKIKIGFEKAGEFLGKMFGPEVKETISKVAQGFRDIADTVGPQIKDLGRNLQPLWDALKVIGVWIGAVLVVAFVDFVGILKIVWSVVNGLIIPVFNFLGDVIGAVIQIIKGIIQFVGGIFQVIMGIFTLDADKIKEGFTNIGKGIMSVLDALWDTIRSLFVNGWEAIKGIVGGLVEGIVGFFTGLWDTLVGHSIIPDMINGIIDWFASLPEKVLMFIGNLIVDIVTFWFNLPGKIFEALSNLNQILTDVFFNAVGWLIEHLPGIIQGVYDFFFGIPDRIISFFAGAGTWLFDAGKNIVQGLMDGVGDFGKKLIDWMLEKIPDAIKGVVKNALGISSPSTVFQGYGQNVVEGMMLGIDDKAPEAAAAAQNMADAVADIKPPEIPPLAGGTGTPDDAIALHLAESMALDTAAAQAAWDAYAAYMATATTEYTTTQTALWSGFSATMIATLNAMYAQMILSTQTFATNAPPILKQYADSNVSIIETMIHTILDAIDRFFKDLLALFTASTQNINTTWQNFATGLVNVFDNTIKPMFDAFQPMLTTLEDWFTATVTNIGTIWAGIKGPVADPAKFIINDVYNNGIRVAWGKVAGWLSLAELEQFVAPFKSGGAVDRAGLRNPNNPIPVGAGGRLRAGNTDDTLFAGQGGEFVLNRKMVRQAGGVPALEAWRQASLRGKSVEGALSSLLGYQAGGEIPGIVKEAQAWAPKTFHGQGYVYGGSGPDGFDCSGMQSAMWSFLTRQPDLWSRKFSTENNFSQFGFSRGLSGLYTIGVHNGGGGPNSHMAGTLAGVNLESGGAHNSSAYGGPAAGADHSQFENQYTLDQIGGEFASGGMGGGSAVSMRQQVEKIFKEVMDPINHTWKEAGGLVGKLPGAGYDKYYKDVSTFLYGKADKIDEERRAIIADVGAGVERWRGTVQQVLKDQGHPLGWDELTLAQIQSESGGNPRAINLTDSNAQKGTPSKGLLQVIDPTFQAYRDRRYADDIWDPFANIAAGLNWVVSAYGGPEGVWGQGHGYDNGGKLKPGFNFNGTANDEPVLTHYQWGLMTDIAHGVANWGRKEVQSGVVGAYVQMFGVDPSYGMAEENAKQLAKANGEWTPLLYDSLRLQADAAGRTADASKRVATSSEKMVGGLKELSVQVNNFSKVMTEVAKAMQSDKQNFTAWAGVIDASATLLESLPDQPATYVSWAGTNRPVTNEMKAEKAMNDISNIAKGTFMMAKIVGPSLLRSTSKIGVATERLISDYGPAVAEGMAMSAVNPVGAAIILVPVILDSIFTLLPLILQAIIDIVPNMIKAIIMFITKYMPDSVYSYTDYEAASKAATEHEGDIRQGASGPNYQTPIQNVNQNENTVIHVYEVNVNADSPESADEFVLNLQSLA